MNISNILWFLPMIITVIISSIYSVELRVMFIIIFSVITTAIGIIKLGMIDYF